VNKTNSGFDAWWARKVLQWTMRAPRWDGSCTYDCRECRRNRLLLDVELQKRHEEEEGRREHGQGKTEHGAV